MVEGLHDSNLSEKFLKAARIELGLVDDLDCNLKENSSKNIKGFCGK